MIKKLLACFGCAFILLLIVVSLVLWQGYRFWLSNPPKEAEELAFEVDAGQGLSGIAAELAERDLIASEFWFKVYAKMSGASRNLQAGQFFLQERMSYASLVHALTDAFTNEIQITIPEGYTAAQMGDIVVENFPISAEEWAAATGPGSVLEQHPFISAAQKPDDLGLEGYLFPDTYRFLPDVSAEEIAGRMVDEMAEHVADLGYTQSTHELLTLASIVEREVRSSDEMKTVAGIFENRLDIGMALQADSTVNYVTGGNDPSVSYEDLDIDSAYNTYRYVGLPPGPIANPGRRALEAAASPEETAYYYFLTSPEGTVYYAETFDGHIANRNLYLR